MSPKICRDVRRTRCSEKRHDYQKQAVRQQAQRAFNRFLDSAPFSNTVRRTLLDNCWKVVNRAGMDGRTDLKLNVEHIVDQALELLREEGMDKLSMRRLAARVGVRAPTLYYYLPDKSALVAAMMERLFLRCLDAIQPTSDWRMWMRGFGRAIWQVQNTYPFTGELITASMLDQERFERTLGRLRSAFASFGPPVDELMGLQSSVQSLMTGWSTFARARFAGQLGQVLDVKGLAFESLDALIRGWRLHQEPLIEG